MLLLPLMVLLVPLLSQATQPHLWLFIVGGTLGGAALGFKIQSHLIDRRNQRVEDRVQREVQRRVQQRRAEQAAGATRTDADADADADTRPVPTPGLKE